MNLLSLFSGIGAYETALKNIGVNLNIKAFCEIDKYAIDSYCALHEIDRSLNLGDIKNIKSSNLPDSIHIITHSSPCTDISPMGKNKGAFLNSNTPSSLIWNSLSIIKLILPQFIVFENVKAFLNPKHKPVFNEYLFTLSKLGYTNSYKVLNSKDYGIPQYRERIYVVSILGKQKPFIFPSPINCDSTVEDFLDLSTNNSNFSTSTFTYNICEERADEGLRSYTHNLCPTLRASTRCGDKVVKEVITRTRNLSPRECWRLMGFSNTDFDKVKILGHSNTQLYKQAGNSVSVNVLEAIFKQLL